MFEKSLYDLIKGLRSHKGNERAYIQDCIRDCRREVKSQDMDLKATALLKLTYLEMWGHDMSWASFNVLEVMSSPKYFQKSVGYLSAVQSFRPDTDVLVLAENLLKKDLASPMPPNISLPLVTIPHIVSQSMANSLLSDLLPRLSHSSPTIRKKTIVTLYRIALVYPETLRPAWPRMKERLLDPEEDPSVTAAVVNVVCELGWRRPQDFLPLAPRLFDLLVEGSNNWMAIKIIKLFAVMTPLEPRLVKKLAPPLTSIIKTTPAMSLLYECINGIIQGGILENPSGSTEVDELAQLCVSKLRGMLTIEGDPNLKYVALLAFNHIVKSYPYLVATHEDVILECIDDPDISIRLCALDLIIGMVNAHNLHLVVDRLLYQLRYGEPASASDGANDHIEPIPEFPSVDSDDEDATKVIKPDPRGRKMQQLPDDYRDNIIGKVLSMCAHNTYANINDFDWYIQALVSLVRQVSRSTTHGVGHRSLEDNQAYRIGLELRNVAVRVKSSRREATQAAESLISIDRRDQLLPPAGNQGRGVLEPAAWIVGEYAKDLVDADATLTSLLHPDASKYPPSVLNAYIQAAMKVFAFVAGKSHQSWSPERKTMTTLLLARMIHFLEPLTTHADLETQELSVQYLELVRLANEAVTSQPTSSPDDSSYAEAPLLLTQAIPSLFMGTELNPVARDAQRKVPIPSNLDLDGVINPNLTHLLNLPDTQIPASIKDTEFEAYYYTKPKPKLPEPAAARLNLPSPSEPVSYQQSYLDPTDAEAASKRRQEQREQYRDDPFYISSSGRATPTHDVLRTNIGDDLDVDSIPIMELKLEDSAIGPEQGRHPGAPIRSSSANKPRRKFEILIEENIGDDDRPSSSGAANGAAVSRTSSDSAKATAASKTKKSLLQVDSSSLGSMSLSEDRKAAAASSSKRHKLEVEKREEEEKEMQDAMREVERLRLEMQRAQERVHARDEGTVVRTKKVRRKAPDVEVETEGAEDAEKATKPKKKKKVKKKEPQNLSAEDGYVDFGAVAKPKKKKKRRQVVFEGEEAGRGEGKEAKRADVMAEGNSG